jgi:hypothetical protein
MLRVAILFSAIAAASCWLPSCAPLMGGRRASGARSHGRRCDVVAQDGFFKQLSKSALDAGSKMGRSALDELQKQAAIAAMQEPEPIEEDAALPPARALPDSFEDSINISIEALKETLADGNTRMVVEFDTSAGDETYNMLSRTLKFVQPFLPPFADVVAPLPAAVPADAEAAADAPADAADAAAHTTPTPPPRVQLLFPDEGTSAYVRNNWADLPAGVECMSMPRAQLLDGVEALLLVAPAATEVAAVQRLLAQVEELAPTTVVVLVNPKLVDMQSTGYGLVGRELRTMVAETFAVPFALQTLMAGALYRVYPGGWSLWREAPGTESGYELAYSSSRRPSGEQMDEILFADDGAPDGPDGGSPLDGLAKFIKGFQAM